MKEIHFKKIQWKKPDLKGKWQKLKNMKPGDIKAHLKKQHERRQQILEKDLKSGETANSQKRWHRTIR